MSLATHDLYTPLYKRLMKQFPLHRITSKEEADAATSILDARFRDRFDDPGEEAYIILLADLLADYEREHDPVPDTATGLDLLKYLMESNGLRQLDVARILKISQAAVSMILSGEREITAQHARRLGKRFGLQPGVFI